MAAVIVFVAVFGSLVSAATPDTASRLGFVGPAIILVDLYDAQVARGTYGPIPQGARVSGDHVVDRDGHRIGRRSGSGFYLSNAVVELARFHDAFSPGWLGRIASGDRPESWRVTVNGAPTEPVALWRRAHAETQGLAHDGFKIAYRHLVALALPRALSPGDRVSVIPPGDETPLAASFDPLRRSEAVQVSQIGYEPGQSKRGHVGLWLGVDAHGRPAATDALLSQARRWRVVHAEDGRDTTVEGVLELERRGDAVTPIAGGASVSTGYDLHYADFSTLERPGRYRLVVEGVGASHPFEIRAGVHLETLRHVIRGLFHARRGQALGPPFTAWRRPAIMERPHRRSTARIAETSSGLGGPDKYRVLKEAPWTGAVTPKFGWQDAGDFDTRPQHLLTARDLMRVGALFPAVAALDLDIPESGAVYDRVVGGVRAASDRPLPDFLHEALWAVDHWRETQEPSGGVHGGYELSQYTGWLGHVGWDPSPGVEAYEYAPDPWASHAYAASAAMAARLLTELGERTLAETYAASALAAHDFAMTEEGSLSREARRDRRFLDDRADAAVQLLALALDHDLAPTAARPELAAALQAALAETPGVDTVAVRSAAALDQWLIGQRGGGGVPPARLAEIGRSIRAQVDLLAAEGVDYFGARRMPDERWRYVSGIAQPRSTYRILRFAWFHRDAFDPEEWRRIVGWIEREPLFALGANPVNMTSITGVGLKPPTDMRHADMRALGFAGPPPGLPLFGPVPGDELAAQPYADVYARRGRPADPRDTPLPMLWQSCGCYTLMSEWTPQDTIRPWLWSLALIDALERAR